jgi:hypothetical protein
VGPLTFALMPNRSLVPALLFPSIAALGACAPAAPPTPPVPCGGAVPASLRVIEGGRISIPRTGELGEATVAITGVESITSDGTLTLLAPYGAGARDVQVSCASGTATLTLEVAPLRWAPVADWDADEANGAPGGREYFAWWLAGEERALYLYGGFSYVPRQFTPTTTLFRFDLRTSVWTSVDVDGAAPGPGGRVATDAAGRVHIFGGAGLSDDGGLETPASFQAIDVAASGVRFEALPSTGALGSYTGSLVYDVRRERWLSVCGVDAFVGLHCQVHAYTEAEGWQRLTTSLERPRGRYGFHYVYDEATDRVIVFGGQVGPENLDIDGETWALDLEPDESGTLAWTRIETPAEISPRRNGAFALDPEGHRMFVWGGTPDGADSVPGIDVLSLERGREVWTHVELEDAPPSRTSAQGVYDASEHRILWGMGNDDAIYTDLWSLELAVREGT